MREILAKRRSHDRRSSSMSVEQSEEEFATDPEISFTSEEFTDSESVPFVGVKPSQGSFLERGHWLPRLGS